MEPPLADIPLREWGYGLKAEGRDWSVCTEARRKSLILHACRYRYAKKINEEKNSDDDFLNVSLVDSSLQLKIDEYYKFRLRKKYYLV